MFNKCLTNVKQFCLEKVNKKLQMKNKMVIDIVLNIFDLTKTKIDKVPLISPR